MKYHVLLTMNKKEEMSTLKDMNYEGNLSVEVSVILAGESLIGRSSAPQHMMLRNVLLNFSPNTTKWTLELKATSRFVTMVSNLFVQFEQLQDVAQKRKVATTQT
ncbi:hypothetical protein JTE90_012042 [Oedothorax gibbosus]|uniref:Uncharacterized protein n=1 Tax=Oedothorax gibbosus TaxID=931172 RepID=A0AAV6TQY9_9ARAC|nr:hypothetical protein JTE90_012042 [Oedothorax gibbosus]